MANEKPNAPKPKTDPEQAWQNKQEQARTSRRRTRQLIGFALSILIIVGAVSIVINGIQLVQNLMQDDDQAEVYRSLYEPLVWFDLLPFEAVEQADQDALKQVAIWGVLNEKGDDIARNNYGEPLVTAIEVDRYAARLFGPSFRFASHGSFTDSVQDLRYTYDEETQTYAAPSTGLMPYYLPTVVAIERESGGERRVVMGYVNTVTSDNQIVMTPDFDHPAKYMDYLLRRDGGDYYLYAIRNNTTYVPETPASTPAVAESEAPDDSSLAAVPPPVSSLPPASSRPESGSEPQPDSSGDDSNTSGEADDGDDDTDSSAASSAA